MFEIIAMILINWFSTCIDIISLEFPFNERLCDTWVTVSEEENVTPMTDNICNEIMNGLEAVVNVTCDYNNRDPPLRGRYVTIKRKDNTDYRFELQFCEVEVMSCPPGRWGYNVFFLGDCVYDCDRCRNITETCRVADGHCFTGCKEGLWGGTCNQSRNCIDDAPCKVSDGYCEGGCRAEYWGGSCDEQCDCPDGTSCNQTDGSCLPCKSEHQSLFPFFI